MIIMNSTYEFLDSLSSHLFFPYITQSTRIRDFRKILFDTIFSNTLIENIISGNLTATISDHLPQSIIMPNIFSNPPSNKSDIYERDWSHLVQENVILDYFSADWNSLVNNNKDVNFFLTICLRESVLFYTAINSLGKSQKRN